MGTAQRNDILLLVLVLLLLLNKQSRHPTDGDRTKQSSNGQRLNDNCKKNYTRIRKKKTKKTNDDDDDDDDDDDAVLRQ